MSSRPAAGGVGIRRKKGVPEKKLPPVQTLTLDYVPGSEPTIPIPPPADQKRPNSRPTSARIAPHIEKSLRSSQNGSSLHRITDGHSASSTTTNHTKSSNSLAPPSFLSRYHSPSTDGMHRVSFPPSPPLSNRSDSVIVEEIVDEDIPSFDDQQQDPRSESHPKAKGHHHPHHHHHAAPSPEKTIVLGETNSPSSLAHLRNSMESGRFVPLREMYPSGVDWQGRPIDMEDEFMELSLATVDKKLRQVQMQLEQMDQDRMPWDVAAREQSEALRMVLNRLKRAHSLLTEGVEEYKDYVKARGQFDAQKEALGRVDLDVGGGGGGGAAAPTISAEESSRIEAIRFDEEYRRCKQRIKETKTMHKNDNRIRALLAELETTDESSLIDYLVEDMGNAKTEGQRAMQATRLLDEYRMWKKRILQNFVNPDSPKRNNGKSPTKRATTSSGVSPPPFPSLGEQAPAVLFDMSHKNSPQKSRYGDIQPSRPDTAASGVGVGSGVAPPPRSSHVIPILRPNPLNLSSIHLHQRFGVLNSPSKQHQGPLIGSGVHNVANPVCPPSDEESSGRSSLAINWEMEVLEWKRKLGAEDDLEDDCTVVMSQGLCAEDLENEQGEGDGEGDMCNQNEAEVVVTVQHNYQQQRSSLASFGGSGVVVNPFPPLRPTTPAMSPSPPPLPSSLLHHNHNNHPGFEILPPSTAVEQGRNQQGQDFITATNFQIASLLRQLHSQLEYAKDQQMKSSRSSTALGFNNFGENSEFVPTSSMTFLTEHFSGGSAGSGGGGSQENNTSPRLSGVGVGVGGASEEIHINSAHPHPPPPAEITPTMADRSSARRPPLAPRGVGTAGGVGDKLITFELDSSAEVVRPSTRDSLVPNTPRARGIFTTGTVCIELESLIGRGGGGSVFRGRILETGEIVAVKKLALKGADAMTKKLVKLEVDIYKQLSHDHVVKYLGSSSSPKLRECHIVMEHIDGGSLALWIKKRGKLSEPQAASAVQQTLLGLSYLHTQKIIHRDVKPANLLLTKSGIVKIIDFGVSTQLKDLQSLKRSCVGTPHYCSPEVIKVEPYSHQTDVWSLGCTLYELLTAERPYANLNAVTALFRMVEDDHPPVPPDLGVSGECRDPFRRISGCPENAEISC